MKQELLGDYIEKYFQIHQAIEACRDRLVELDADDEVIEAIDRVLARRQPF